MNGKRDLKRVTGVCRKRGTYLVRDGTRPDLEIRSPEDKRDETQPTRLSMGTGSTFQITYTFSTRKPEID